MKVLDWNVGEFIFSILSLATMCALVFAHYDNVSQYMDEIFHIPQAQHYCQNDFQHWDPKITTFPGLYWVSYLLRSIVLSSGVSFQCDIKNLRLINVFISSMLPYGYFCCRNKLFPERKDGWLVATLLYLYPLSAFYYPLYYTDTLSTASLALVYCCVAASPEHSTALKTTFSLRAVLWHLFIFALASVAILARQTNAVWVLFLAGTQMLSTVSDTGGKQLAESICATPDSRQLLWFVKQLWSNKVILLLETWSLLLPVALFVAFVMKNGSIVLGDKENHQPVVHLAMLTHMLFVVGVVSLPFAVSEWFQHRGQPSRAQSSQSTCTKASTSQFWSVMWLILVSLAAAYCLVRGSISHPFLLADNRHYTFYLWSRVLRHEKRRILMSPLYSAVVCVAVQRLSRSRGWLWTLIFLIAGAITLLPTPLLEPRYVTPGVVIALLNSPEIPQINKLDVLTSTLVIAGFVLCNLATMYIFIYRPFVWPDGSVARFMF